MKKTSFAAIFLLFLSFNAVSQDVKKYEPRFFDSEKFWGDTLPYRAMDAIKEFKLAEAQRLEKYLSKANLSADEIGKLRLEHNYLAAGYFYSYKGGNKFKIRAAYKRNFKSWQDVQDSLFSQIELSNDEALSSSLYKDFVSTFLLREKERLWEESSANPEGFFKDWYDTDIEKGKKLFEADMSNVLKEKIINFYFKDKTAEYMYSMLFHNIKKESDPTNALPIYERFKQKYPESEYIKILEPQMKAIASNQLRPINSKMNFLPNNGSMLNTFDDLLVHVKGKAVLLDMWGTWCGPCREEMEKNGPVLKAHFANTDLDFLYVANFDLKNEKKWKDLIAYFNLEGTHVLANDLLNKSIMTRVKRQGYPTYIIIKKDGSFELSEAGYPMNRSVLIKQLEKALKE